jgi:hypothetical protein
VPVALAINNTRASIPNIIIANSGSQRFDLYKGLFTVNDQFTVSPFNDAFLYIASVPASIANQVLPSLNSAGANGRRKLEERETELYARGYVDATYNEWLEKMNGRDGVEKRASANLTLGYVTTDVSFLLDLKDCFLLTSPVLPWSGRRHAARTTSFLLHACLHWLHPSQFVSRHRD